jgi:hypothetical protein
VLEQLKVVMGAVQERAVLQELSHVCIYQGRVQGTNARIAIDAPIQLGVDAVVPAARFLAAIEGANDNARIEIKDGKLHIISGRFRAKVPILYGDRPFPRKDPDPFAWVLEEPLLPTIKRLRPFVADDASNAWATSLLIDQETATATNNVCLLAEPCSMLRNTAVERVAIPGTTLDEMIRMRMEPTGFGVSQESVTLYFGEVWMKTQLIAEQWPTTKVSDLLAGLPRKMTAIPGDLSEAVNKITPFCKDDKFPVVIMRKDGVYTEEFDHSAEVSGFDLPEMRFNATMLRLVLDRAERFQSLGKDRAAFAFGPVRGVIMGLRQ